MKSCSLEGLNVIATNEVLDEVLEERARQERKWGVQNHIPTDWLPILTEEFGEIGRALCEAKADPKFFAENMANYREELIQTAAVCVAMVESWDRNK